MRTCSSIVVAGRGGIYPRSPPQPLPETGRDEPARLTARSQVAATAERDRLADLLHDAAEVIDDVFVGEAQHSDAFASEANVLVDVVLLVFEMNGPVDLDCQVAIESEEIHDVAKKWALPSERRTGLAIPQLAPEDVFLGRHSSTENARLHNGLDRTRTMSHPLGYGTDRASEAARGVATNRQGPPRFGEGRGRGTGIDPARSVTHACERPASPSGEAQRN